MSNLAISASNKVSLRLNLVGASAAESISQALQQDNTRAPKLDREISIEMRSYAIQTTLTNSTIRISVWQV